MRHTFRIEEGVWRATGSYSNERGHIVSIKGESKLNFVTYNISFWTNETQLILEPENDSPIEMKNRYIIRPFEKNRDYTSWGLEHSLMGRLSGKLVVAGDSIISTFSSHDGAFRGSEIIIMIDEENYKNRGCIFHGEKKIVSWWLDLKKIR